MQKQRRDRKSFKGNVRFFFLHFALSQTKGLHTTITLVTLEKLIRTAFLSILYHPLLSQP